MTTPLLTTKLYIPPVWPALVSRPRLVARAAWRRHEWHPWDIYIMNADGAEQDSANLQRLTTSEASDLEPDWSP